MDFDTKSEASYLAEIAHLESRLTEYKALFEKVSAALDESLKQTQTYREMWIKEMGDNSKFIAEMNTKLKAILDAYGTPVQDSFDFTSHLGR